MRGLYFDRFDVCEAYYMFAAEFHSGQTSPEYAIFGRLHKIGFKPRPNIDTESLTENAALIYNSLIRERSGWPVQHACGGVDSDGDSYPWCYRVLDGDVIAQTPMDISCAVCRREQ